MLVEDIHCENIETSARNKKYFLTFLAMIPLIFFIFALINLKKWFIQAGNLGRQVPFKNCFQEKHFWEDYLPIPVLPRVS